MKTIQSALIIICIICISCTDTSQTATSSGKSNPVTLKGDDTILATVNNTPITQYDLDQTILTTLSSNAAQHLDKTEKRKILESLVTGRAIALTQEKNLEPEQAAALEKKVNTYREQLLIKQYMAKNTQIEPVSMEMVTTYYKNHPERFGAKTIQTCEMIFTSGPLNPSEREKLVNALNTPPKTDWKAWHKHLKSKGFPVAYQKEQVDENNLQQDLKNIVKPLKKGDVSRPTFIKNAIYLVRTIDEHQIPPKPLNEVKRQIRKSLAPIQLKKAVKQASADILKETTIVYN